MEPVKTHTVTDSEMLAAKFEKVKEGMTEQQVLRIMGDPQHREAAAWQYTLTRAPQAGEQLMIYQVIFRDHKVVQKQIAGGADATGPAPIVKH